MLITDYSEQTLNQQSSNSSTPITELITAGMIFILPILFLLIVTAG